METVISRRDFQKVARTLAAHSEIARQFAIRIGDPILLTSITEETLGLRLLCRAGFCDA